MLDVRETRQRPPCGPRRPGNSVRPPAPLQQGQPVSTEPNGKILRSAAKGRAVLVRIDASRPRAPRIQAKRQQGKRAQHDAQRQHCFMRHRGGEPYADCGVHHLPETQQRLGRAGFLPEWGERPRSSQWTDDANAEEKYAHRRQKRQEGRADRRDEQDRNAAGGRRAQSRPDRPSSP